ncbi:winged helix-turn-helix domain-containing protein [Microtetraspora sp. NBRC 13810]|uniref:ArsR/SmtB family transcription factor n=1 Tax=Microtetraspora sp. NBRC 13810 TaxID=3030990 RepID=UPI00255750C2|nr:winged helix-turn-helix domain-containing protein [Microtetraspora sp. NBRC 13810]
MSEYFQISDPRTLKAVAHPLRVRMLGRLRTHGPATATELAREVGESSGLTSYHLRELAKYGFIEEDPGQRDARERRWRAKHQYTAWRNADMAGTPEGRAAAGAMRGVQLSALTAEFAAFEQDMGAMTEDWVNAIGMSNRMATLTPASVLELWTRLVEVIDELVARDEGDPAAKEVHVHLAAFLRTHLDSYLSGTPRESE